MYSSNNNINVFITNKVSKTIRRKGQTRMLVRCKTEDHVLSLYAYEIIKDTIKCSLSPTTN